MALVTLERQAIDENAGIVRIRGQIGSKRKVGQQITAIFIPSENASIQCCSTIQSCTGSLFASRCESRVYVANRPRHNYQLNVSTYLPAVPLRQEGLSPFWLRPTGKSDYSLLS